MQWGVKYAIFRLLRARDKPVHADVSLPYPPMRFQHVRQRPLAQLHDRVVVGDEVAHEPGDLAAQRLLVDGLYLAIPDDHATINDHALHAAPRFRIDELTGSAVVRKVF